MKFSINQLLMRCALVVLLLSSTAMANAQKWDAATCGDICYIVAEGGRNIDQILQNKCGYTHIDNMNTGEDGYLALYSRNARVDMYGNLLGLSKTGISSIVMAHLSSGPCKIVIAFFSTANAKRFRDQALEIGFKKTKSSRKSTFYAFDNFGMEETTDKIGRFTAYEFIMQPLYMY